MGTNDRLRFQRPPQPSVTGAEEFFAGIWVPRGVALHAQAMEDPDTRVIRGGHWILLGSRSSGGRALVHSSARGALAFRGYSLDPPVHGWCAPEAVLRAWMDRTPERPNGVFAAVRIRADDGSLELWSDLLGVSSLYYRRCGDAVMFATSPRYLLLAEDRPDRIAWRNRIAAGTVVGDDSLVEGIHRTAPGTRVRFESEGRMDASRWFPWSDLANPDRTPTESAIRQLEESFNDAVLRIAGLPEATHTIPLSSGYDSKRILAAFLEEELPFEALTVRILQKDHRDLDARYTTELASRYGFPHRVLEVPGVEEYLRLDRDRRLLMAGESLHHTWILPLCMSLCRGPTLVWDGLAGDVLGETGFMDLSLFGPHVGPREITRAVYRTSFDGVLGGPAWPCAHNARARIESWLGTLPRNHLAELGFLLSRTRREIAAWSQRLLPVGHVPVYPYLDLDYVRLALSINPRPKLERSLQEICLDRFHPAVADHPGSRRIPSDLPPGNAGEARRLSLAHTRALERELGLRVWRDGARNLLRERARVLHRGALLLDRLATKTGWWRTPFLEMLGVEQDFRPAWIRNVQPRNAT